MKSVLRIVESGVEGGARERERGRMNGNDNIV